MNPVNSSSRVAASLAIAGLLAVPGAAGLFLFPDAMPVASAQSSSTATSSSTADADVTLDSQLVDDIDAAVNLLDLQLRPNDVVLVKASYSDGLWGVAQGLLANRRGEVNEGDN